MDINLLVPHEYRASQWARFGPTLTNLAHRTMLIYLQGSPGVWKFGNWRVAINTTTAQPPNFWTHGEACGLDDSIEHPDSIRINLRRDGQVSKTPFYSMNQRTYKQYLRSVQHHQKVLQN